MKGMIGFAVLALAAGFALMTWNANEWSRDHGQWIGLAFDKPGANGVMKMHICVQQGLLMTDPPKVTENGAVLYNEWVDDHFTLTDGQGQDIDIRRIAHSPMISDRQAMNVEFFLEARLTPGGSYTVDYIPVTTGTQRYRYEFSAPTAAQEFARENFDPV